jgi:hypothetical protein
MYFMVVETYTHGPEPVYDRFRACGRMAPDGLEYISSFVTLDGARCYQMMRCDDASLLEAWMAAWRDLVSFDVVPVITSAEAAQRFTSPANRPLG